MDVGIEGQKSHETACAIKLIIEMLVQSTYKIK